MLAAGDGAAGWCVAVCATAGMLAAYLEPEAGGGGLRRACRRRRRRLRPLRPRRRRAARALELAAVGASAATSTNCDWVMGGCVVARRRRAAAARVRAPRHPPRADARRRGRGDRHLVGLRPARDRQPRHRRRRARGTGGALGLADHRRPRERGPLYAFPPFGLLAGGDRRGRARDRPRGARRPGGARRRQDTDAEHPQARRARRDPVGRRPRRGRGARRAGAALRGRCRGLGGGALGRRGSRSSCAPGCGSASTNAVESAGGGRRRRLVARRRQRDLRDRAAQRRFRDIHAATQHMLVGPRHGSWPGARCWGWSSTPRSCEACAPALVGSISRRARRPRSRRRSGRAGARGRTRRPGASQNSARCTPDSS